MLEDDKLNEGKRLVDREEINREYIENRLDDLGIASWVISRYDEPHRFYHNLEHIIRMLKGASDLGMLNNDTLFLAIVFHDIIYNPIRKDNEEKSAELFNYVYDGDVVMKREVTRMILDTITHKSDNELSQILIKLDLLQFEGSCEEMIKDHDNIYKEYAPYYTPKQFQEGNLKVLDHFKKMGYDLDCLIDYVKKRY